MTTRVIDDIQPKAVMAPDEQRRRDVLPREEQVARLRAALQHGFDSGLTDVTMDQLWDRVRARHAPSYKLSGDAVTDIDAILDGVRTFGLRHATEYHFELEACFKLLAQFPGTAGFEILPDLYRYP